MDAVSAYGKSNIGARVNQKTRWYGPTARFVGDSLERLTAEFLEIAGGEVFFPQLDKIDAAGCGFGNLGQQLPPTRAVLPRKLLAISDVIDERAWQAVWQRGYSQFQTPTIAPGSPRAAPTKHTLFFRFSGRFSAPR